jgi:adenylate cyclase
MHEFPYQVSTSYGPMGCFANTMKRSLIVNSPDGSERVFPLTTVPVKIGRAVDNDVVLTDSERSVSRYHAVLESDGDGAIKLADLKSANGTTVNGRKVDGPVLLNAGDSIEIGQFQVIFHEEEPDDPRFTIVASDLQLDDLQNKSGLLNFAGGDASTASEVRNLELLYEVGVTLARSHSVEDVTEAAIGLLFKIGQVHRAAVMLWEEDRGRFDSAGLHMRNVGRMGDVPQSYDPSSLVMSRTILTRVRRENRPLLIRDAKSEAMLEGAASIVRAGIQAAFCSPLTFQGRFLGILYADNLAEPDAFSQADFRTFTSIAAQTGLALANAIAGRQLIVREVERQALKRYLPPQVADLIVASGGASQLRGVLQPVTVLYADIRGFTTMSEQMDAREIVDLLREFFTVMSGVILECNGTLDKFIGDCIMALFGAPVQSEQAASEGLRAAIRMQEEMQRLNRLRSERGAPPFYIGIGLHCGPAVVGNIGSADRVQYTAIGDTVNVAARLVSKAAASQIIVSEDVQSSAGDLAEFTSLGEVELKGRAGKLNIYSAQPVARKTVEETARMAHGNR